MAKKWIAKAIKRPGALTRAAKRAGAMTKGGKVQLGKMERIAEKRGGARLKKQVALAKTLKGLRKKK